MPKIDNLIMTKHGQTLELVAQFRKPLESIACAVLQEKGLNYMYLARNDR